ncbi:MAG: uroporphyrinogen decarboxylase family protein [Thermodesulfobacteriota bacterium]
MWTPKQRFGALRENRLPDRVPVVCNLFEQGAKELGMTIKDYYASGQHVAEGQLKLQEKYGYDNIWSSHYTARDTEMLGAKSTVFVDDGPPNVGHLILRSEADIDRLVIDEALLDTKPFLEELKTVEIVKREKGQTCPVLSTVVGAFSMPPILMGMDKWLDFLLTGPEKARRVLLKKCSDFCIMKMKALFAAGVDMIAYSNPLATTGFLNQQQIESMALEWVERDIKTAGTAGIVYFNGGSAINDVIDAIAERTGVGVFYISPMDNISDARKIIAGRALLASAINDIKLLQWSEARIETEVKQIMEAGKAGGGFIFGTLVMPYAISDDKIKTMLESAYYWGRYSNSQ